MEAGPGQAIKEEASVQEAKRVAWNDMKWHESSNVIYMFLGFFRILRFIRFCPTQAPFEPWRPSFWLFLLFVVTTGQRCTLEDIHGHRANLEKHPDVTEVLSAVSKVALGVFAPTVAELITFHGSLKVWHQPKKKEQMNKLFQVHTSGGLKLVLVAVEIGGQVALEGDRVAGKWCFDRSAKPSPKRGPGKCLRSKCHQVSRSWDEVAGSSRNCIATGHGSYSVFIVSWMV